MRFAEVLEMIFGSWVLQLKQAARPENYPKSE
jgi:hypothetical protein